MTAQEQQMIDDLVQRIRSTPAQDKDVDAEQRLQQGLAGYPDAVYVLAQTVLVQQYGLDQAQQQIQAMQAELDRLHQEQVAPARSGGSFLSSLFGTRQPATPPPPPMYQAAPQQGYPMAYPQTGGGGGFMRSAMQTAAGVAMGEMAFQGMESLFHGFGGGGYGESRPEVVNNYYGDEPHHEAASGRDDSSFYNPKDDASRESESSQFADTTGGDGGNGASDSSDDNSDFGSGDDGGGSVDDSGF